jgi:hypothetical protein
MLHTLRYIRHGIIILLLTVLSFGVEGKANLCFTPDGNVHLEQNRSSCGLAGEECSATTNVFTLSNNQTEGQDHCLDVTLEEDVSNHHHRDIVQLPAPAMTSAGPPIILTLSNNKPFIPPAPAFIPPQLVSLKSIILLI